MTIAAAHRPLWIPAIYPLLYPGTASRRFHRVPTHWIGTRSAAVGRDHPVTLRGRGSQERPHLPLLIQANRKQILVLLDTLEDDLQAIRADRRNGCRIRFDGQRLGGARTISRLPEDVKRSSAPVRGEDQTARIRGPEGRAIRTWFKSYPCQCVAGKIPDPDVVFLIRISSATRVPSGEMRGYVYALAGTGSVSSFPCRSIHTNVRREDIFASPPA